MKRLICSLLLLVVVLSAGCTMAPKYSRPEASVPPEWPEGLAYPDSLVISKLPSASEMSPQEFFEDTLLQQVIELALDNNLDLRLAALNVEKVRAYYKIKRADLFPSITALGVGGKSRVPADLSPTGAAGTIEQYSVDVGIASWEIDFFGRVRSEKNQALEQYLATESARRGAQISLVSAVGQAYLSLAASRELLQLAHSTLESQQAFYGLIERQYKGGLASKLDLRRAQTQVNIAQRNVAIYTQLAAEDQNALNLLAGTPVPSELLPENLSSVSPPRDVDPGLSSTVLLNRPDIMAAEHQLKAAYAYIGVARAAFFPRISLTALAGTASSALSGLFTSGSDTWRLGSQVALPIFDPRIHAALRVTEADQEIILTQYQKTIQVAFKEVADALAVKNTINQQVAAQESLVEATDETYSLAQKRYTKGIDNFLSVLDAHRSLYFSQQVLVTLRLAKLANQVQLYAVLGGGAMTATETNQ
ncbi:MAG: multidrug transporter [Verrucomicrobia bacterium]|nr:MAG: multidrug transporter [Verrucomicrobiota bacterium]